MNNLKTKIYSLSQFDQLNQDIRSDKPLHLKGVAGSFRAFIAAYFAEQIRRPVLYLSSDQDSAERMRDDLEMIVGANRVGFLAALEFEPYADQETSPSLISLRMEAMQKMILDEPWIIVTTPQGLAEPLPVAEEFVDQQIYLKTGISISFDKLIPALSRMGLKREDVVQQVGDFSVRGGIIDIFAWSCEEPVRIEFFGNRIESIRKFDVFSQRSTEILDELLILPNLFQSATRKAFIGDLLPDSAILFIEDEALAEQKMEEWQDRARSQYELRIAEGIEDSAPQERYFSVSDLTSLKKQHAWCETGLVQTNSKAVIDFGTKSHPDFNGSLKLFLEYIQKQAGIRPNPQIIIQTSTKEQSERLEDILDEESVPFNGKIVSGPVHNGFIIPELHLQVLTDHEIFNRFKRRRTYRRFKSGAYLRQLSGLNVYDYVVHVDYGIGKYLGMERVDFGGNTKECIKIGYENNDYLYVTVDRLNRVQKFSSEEGVTPKLTKLGSKEWEKTKARTRESLKKVAAELIRIYAARKAQGGHAFSEDAHWQKELEASFPFEETEDQLISISAVKRDMENEQPMDRLLCGDVGFGKTEVALRAAFKAIMDGKQAAVLVPTTILAFQHHQTFSQRLKEFPVVVEMLNRFRTAKEQKRIVHGLATGQIDLVIGTHRLLSDDIHFKDLGLLIIDEEQRFGVKQKEKLKEYRLSVDILSMTATPIPRTLHMALMGARDLSNIDTPPANRLPVHTEIMHWDDEKLRYIITREIQRGGQIYFVHNRVQTIGAIKEALGQIVPEARIAVGHGQLPERRLEKVMLDFMDQKYDILLASMIIENGLDIPNVNTIIINRADKFGLSQLYQLRGRVGRSTRQAYAYLLVPPINKLTEVARKRLRAIQDFTDLGSGYKVALRDLEIRGAGNLLGREQSGFVQSVGFDLYCRILDEAVRELKSGTLDEKEALQPEAYVDAKLDVDFDLFIPETYISSELERITIYHRLVNFTSLSQIEEIRRELTDRFGPLPQEAEVFMRAVEIKVLAGKLYAGRVIVKGEKIKIIFSEEAQKDEGFYREIIPSIMNQKLAPVQFLDQKELAVEMQLSGRALGEKLDFAKKILQSIASVE